MRSIAKVVSRRKLHDPDRVHWRSIRRPNIWPTSRSCAESPMHGLMELNRDFSASGDEREGAYARRADTPPTTAIPGFTNDLDG